MPASESELEKILSFSISWKSLKKTDVDFSLNVW